MKKVSIISSPDMRMVQGINYVTKTLSECNRFFREIQITRAYSEAQMVNVEAEEKIPIGSNLGAVSTQTKDKLRALLRELFSSKFYPFALLKYYLNYIRWRKYAINRFVEDNPDCDYIIFQDIQAAYQYFIDDRAQKMAKLKGIKTIVIIHAERDDLSQMLMQYSSAFVYNRMKKLLYSVRDYVYQRVDAVMYISKKAYNNSIVPDKRIYVYNGVPDLKYEFHEEPHNVLEFICVGSISGRKGQELLIEAVKLLDDAHKNKIHLTIVGGGTALTKLKQQLLDAGLTNVVTILGIRNDVDELLRDKDVFILPSKDEGLPMSALEALRAGCYQMLTDVGGCLEIIDEKSGVLITRNPEDIKSEIISVIDGNKINIEQKKYCRERFLNMFSQRCMAEGYEKTLLGL